MSQQKDEFEKLITRKINQLNHEINKVKEENLELHKTVKDLSERLEQFEDTSTSTEQFFESIKKRKKFWEIVRKKLEGSLYEDVRYTSTIFHYLNHSARCFLLLLFFDTIFSRNFLITRY